MKFNEKCFKKNEKNTKDLEIVIWNEIAFDKEK